MGMNRALRLLVLPAAAALLVAFLSLLTLPAHAAAGHLRVSGGVHVDGLSPGGSGSGELTVTNDSSYDARLDLEATDVVDDENGCLRQERQVPSEQCAADGGELGDELLLTITHDGDALWSGALPELERGVTLTQHLAPGVSWQLRMEVALPFSSGNETMTDSTGFGLRFTASGQGGTIQVDAPGVHAGTGGGAPAGSGSGLATPVSLPLTGASVPLWVLLLDVVTLLVGAVLLAARRRRPFGAPRPA